MKKKGIWLIVILVALFIFVTAFFASLPLSDLAEKNSEILMVYSEFGVRNGEAYIDSSDYQDITKEQKSAILSIFDKYAYRRTFGTPFSDGAISELGDKTLSIYVYDDVSLTNSIFVSSSEKIAINGKSYGMKNAEQFIEQIIEIVKQEDVIELE